MKYVFAAGAHASYRCVPDSLRSWSRPARWLLKLLAVVPLALVANAQQQPPPTYKTGVDAVVLDVSVLDANRHPVRGLGAADFSVFEDGDPQPITVFSAVEAPAASPGRAVPAWARETPQDVFTNDVPTSGRLIVLVLDDLLPMAPGESPRAKDLASRVIDSLAPSDLVAVAFVSGTRPGVDFTTDHARLRAAATTFEPRWSSDFDSTSLMDVQGRLPMYWLATSTIRRIVNSLASVPGRRKAILWLSAGLPFAMDAESIDELSKRDNLAEEWLGIFNEAARSNVTIYPLSAGGLRGVDVALAKEKVPTFGRTSGDANERFFEVVAENTGGFAVMRNNDPAPALARVIDETGSYYLVGYQSSHPVAKGKRHRLKVTVNRPGVTVRTRTGYVSLPASTRAIRTMEAALRSPTPVDGVVLRATVAPFLAADGRSPVLALVLDLEETTPARPKATTDTVEVVAQATDSSGKPAGSVATHVRVGVAAGADRVRYEVLTPLTVKPGHYDVRVASTTSLEPRAGAVTCAVDVPDFGRDAVSLSGLVVGINPGGFVTPRDALRAFLPVVPTARRTFSGTDRVTVLLRAYQGGTGETRDVPLLIRLLDGTGAAVIDRRETLSAAAFQQNRSADWRLPLPLAQLGSGPYLLTIETSNGKTSIRRTAQFDVTR